MTTSDRDQTLRQLAERIRLIESTRPMATEAIALDGGLGRLFPLAGGMFVELIAATEGAGAWSIALALAKAACGSDRLLLVADQQRCFYPPAAVKLGIDLRQLAVARCDSVRDTLLAASQALRTTGVGAVIGEFDRLGERDGRRLQLAAETGGGVGLFIRPLAALHAPSFATVRLLLSPLPATETHRRISVQVLRCHPDNVPRSTLVEIDDATGDVRTFPSLDAAASGATSPRPAG